MENKKMTKKWTVEEEDFLKKNYIIKGTYYCSKQLGITSKSVTSKFRHLSSREDFKKNKGKRWSKNEIKFLKQSFSYFGKDYCAKKLDRTSSSVLFKAKSLNLKLTNEELIKKGNKLRLESAKKSLLKFYSDRPNDKSNVNVDYFLNIKLKEVAYMLGLLWSDGSIWQTEKANAISLQMIKKDLDTLVPVFLKVGKWSQYVRDRKNWQTSLTITTNNRKLLNFLLENDYDKKSHISADKILLKIPNELKHYFYRGVFDGDGCFYFNEKNNTKQATVSGTYEQDWTYIERVYKSLEINYKIKKTISKNGGKGSMIRICGFYSIKKFGDFIYKDYKKDKIGLKRKYDKFLECINIKYVKHPEKQNKKDWSLEKDYLIKRIKELLSKEYSKGKISKFLSIPYTTLDRWIKKLNNSVTDVNKLL